jgi:hypothetical protein
MSFIAYLCWLLGMSVPTDCDAANYGNQAGWTTEECGTQDGNVEPPKDEGQQHNTPPRHARGTNISVSI